MTHNTTPSPQMPHSPRPSRLRQLFYISMIIFFLVMAFVAYTVVQGVQKANESIVAPIGELVGNLFVPATPVILPDGPTIVGQIKDMSRLETTSYQFEKVVTAQRVQEIFGVEIELESMVFVGYGTVVAGVDFSKMQVEDLQVVDPDTVMVHLPPAEIFDDLPVLDTERSYVADRDTMLLVQADPELETQMRQAAEQSIKEAAQASDILDRANANAQEFMMNFLQGLGFEEVIFMADTPPTAVPYEQELPKGYILVTVTPERP